MPDFITIAFISSILLCVLLILVFLLRFSNRNPSNESNTVNIRDSDDIIFPRRESHGILGVLMSESSREDIGRGTKRGGKRGRGHKIKEGGGRGRGRGRGGGVGKRHSPNDQDPTSQEQE